MHHKSVIFSVPDMHCASCPKIIAMNLEENPGVITVDSSLETKQVKITFDPDQTDPGKLGDIIRDTGYTPQLIVNTA